MALLEPIEGLRSLESHGDYTQRFALLEEIKGLPFGAGWDYCCLKHDVPIGLQFMTKVLVYKQKVLAER